MNYLKMRLLYGKDETSFYAIGMFNKFSLMRRDEYLSINRSSSVYIDGIRYDSLTISNTHKSFFWIDLNFSLRMGSLFVKYVVDPKNSSETENSYATYIGPTDDEKTIKCKISIYDFQKWKKRGSYSLIFFPSFYENNNHYISRLCMSSKIFSDFERNKETLEQFCLLPNISVKDGMFTIQNYKRCKSMEEIHSLFQFKTLFEFITLFEHLYIGVAELSNLGIFHGDINNSNIVLDDVFKFIDLDSMIYYKEDDYQNSFFKYDEFLHIYPRKLHIKIFYYINRKKEKVNMNEGERSELVEYLKYIQCVGESNKCFNVIRNNSTFSSSENIEELRKETLDMNEIEIDNLFSFVSYYQLTVALYCYCKIFSRIPQISFVYDFICDILDFEKNGLQTKDQIIFKFRSMKSQTRPNNNIFNVALPTPPDTNAEKKIKTDQIITDDRNEGKNPGYISPDGI